MAFQVTFNEYEAAIYQHYDNEVDGRKVGADHLSAAHDFVPYPALMSGKLLKKGEKKLLVYSRYIGKHHHYSRRTYDSFLTEILTQKYWTLFKKRGVELNIWGRYGELVHVESPTNTIPLAVLAVNERYLYRVNKATPDPSQFFLVVNNQLVNEERYDSLYRAFKKYYLAEVQKVVNVIYTDDIHSLLYKPHIVKPKPAKTLVEMKQNMLEFHNMVIDVAINS